MGLEFSIGQRWVSDTEPELGLGIVEQVDQRTVQIRFLSNNTARNYMIQNAPLTRAYFKSGDIVVDMDNNRYLVNSHEMSENLLLYRTRSLPSSEQSANPNGDAELSAHESDAAIPKSDGKILLETRLSPFLTFQSARDRLFSGQIDKNEFFNLRHDLCQSFSKIKQSDVFGLLGARTALIPHQYHIANQVASRHAPRVLLADEVGLGKTIEAGLIIHQQLIKDLAKRVLILVPETLQHQWLVELMRRFNLQFSLYDEDRCASYSDNPFENSQLVICSLDWLANSNARGEQALACEWDLLIVDEAHHLTAAVEGDAPELANKYSLVEELAYKIPGLLLLTGTPQQLGVESHFERLKLLDPLRFNDLQQFLDGERDFSSVAKLIAALIDADRPSPELEDQFQQFLQQIPQDQKQKWQSVFADQENFCTLKNELVEELIDLHGTGRVLFRNTRASITGFPQRKLCAIPLPLPEAYACARNTDDEYDILCPERLYQDEKQDIDADWWTLDPRFQWLADYVNQHHKEKILIICHHARTVINIEKAFRTLHGTPVALFHEGMNIIERDRAAAYFSDFENGARVLVCSEIGSEGRNFQFCHHLVLFDLPACPDLLEQRIGRLDRIGQKHDIIISVPYFQHHGQELIFNWYQHSLNCFENLSASAQLVHDFYNSELNALLFAGQDLQLSSASVQDLLQQGQNKTVELNKNIEAGRDRILEINSSGQFNNNDIVAQIRQQEDATILQNLFNQLVDIYGLHSDLLNPQTLIVKASDEMLVEQFPGISEEGVTLSFDREQALTREEWQFGSWDHPIIRNSFEMFLQDHNGSASVALYQNRNLPSGTMLLEFLYIVDAPASVGNQLSRFLPEQHIRLLCTPKGVDLSDKISFAALSKALENIDKAQAKSLIEVKADDIRKGLIQSETLAEAKIEDIKNTALDKVTQYFDHEINRLESLKHKQAPVRQSEIDYFIDQKDLLSNLIAQASGRLDAVRVIFIS